MNKKKSDKVNLDKMKFVFFQIGLIIALFVIYLTFEYTLTANNTYDTFTGKHEQIDEEMIPVVRIKEPEPPKPKEKQKVIEKILIVDDETEIIDEIDITEIIPDDSLFFVEIEPEPEIDVDEIVPFYACEKFPEFLDGKAETLLGWIRDNTEYPKLARELGIEGTVWVGFMINTSGEVIDIRLLRPTDPLLDKEALRVINSMPRWKAGIQAGKKVIVPYQLPIKFVLQ